MAETRQPKPAVPVPDLLPAKLSLAGVREMAAGCRLSRQRGESSLAPLVTATVHHSSILRAPSDEARHEKMPRFAADLERIAGASR